MDYVRLAARDGLPVVQAGECLPFPDSAFDTALLFEVIEYVASAETLVAEAFRVSRSNVLVTVPNCKDLELMKANDVTYAHMLASDHLHFFDTQSLRRLLDGHAEDVTTDRADPIYPHWFLSKSLLFYVLRLMYRTQLLKPRFFSRLYAVARVCKD